MTKTQMWISAVPFLLIIYSIPIHQAAYEFIHNPGHHVQMLDLVTDLFVPPDTSDGKAPSHALNGFFMGEQYLRNYEREMLKASLFANTVRPWTLVAWYALFKDLGDKGLRGRDGWLFYRPDVDYLTRPSVLEPRSLESDPNDVVSHDAVLDTIVAFRDLLKGKGIDLVMVFMPAKPSIYPDLLASRAPASLSGRFSHTLSLIRRLKERGVDAVNLFQVFAEARQNNVASGDSLYLKSDTHFKGRAVLLTARTVAEHLRRYPWYRQGNTEYNVDTVSIPRTGDLLEMTGLTSAEFHRSGFSFFPETVTCFKVWQIGTNDSTHTPYHDDYKNSNVLVLGDSYSRIYQTDPPRAAGWIAHLAREIHEPVASIVNDGGASTLVRETLARKPNVLKGKKVVVWEIVERDIRFGEGGWRDIRF